MWHLQSALIERIKAIKHDYTRLKEYSQRHNLLVFGVPELRTENCVYIADGIIRWYMGLPGAWPGVTGIANREIEQGQSLSVSNHIAPRKLPRKEFLAVWAPDFRFVPNNQMNRYEFQTSFTKPSRSVNKQIIRVKDWLKFNTQRNVVYDRHPRQKQHNGAKY